MANNVFAPEVKSEDYKLLSEEEISKMEASYNYCTEYLKSFKTFDAFDFKKVLLMCDDLLTSGFIETIPSLNQNGVNAYESLYSTVINAMNKDFNGKKIGDILITKSIEDGEVLIASELLYDCDKQYKKMGLRNIPRLGLLESKSAFHAIADFISSDILINTYDRYKQKMINKDPNKARAISLELLIAIRHEFQHIVQGLECYGPSHNEAAANKLLFEMEIRQRFDVAAVYGLYHDLFPSEYDADIVSYATVISDLQNDYKTEYSDILIDFVREMEEERKKNYKPQSMEMLIDHGLSQVDLPENIKFYLLTKLEDLQSLILTEDATTQSNQNDDTIML